MCGQAGVRGLVVKMFQALRIPAAGCRGREYRCDVVCRAQSIHERLVGRCVQIAPGVEGGDGSAAEMASLIMV